MNSKSLDVVYIVAPNNTLFLLSRRTHPNDKTSREVVRNHFSIIPVGFRSVVLWRREGHKRTRASLGADREGS